MIALVLSLSFILLTVVFRSIVIATKAIIMNLLSVSVAYGILVLVWQKGIGNEIFGLPQVDVIQAWLRHAVRPIHGLPGIHDKPHPGALPSDW